MRTQNLIANIKSISVVTKYSFFRLIGILDDFFLEICMLYWRYQSQREEFDFNSREPKSHKWRISYYLFKANAYVNSGVGYDRASAQIIEAHKEFSSYHKQVVGHDLSDADALFLDPGWATNIGHTAMLSIFPKLEQSGLSKEKQKTLFYIDTSNEPFLNLYKAHFSMIRISSKSFLKQNFINRNLLVPMGAFETNIGLLNEYDAHNLAESEYNKISGGNPFFSPNLIEEDKAFHGLSAETKSRLRNPFVIFHIRSSPAISNRSANNADISSYFAAMKFLLKKGFTVIRLGDPSMPSIAETEFLGESFIDYAHSHFRSPLLDLFLWSHAQFAVSTSSGPAWIPNEFGVPSLLTNAPHPTMIYGIKGFFLPHKYYNQTTGLPVHYRDVVRSGFGSSWAEKNQNYVRERNSPSEIYQGVQTMYKQYVDGRETSVTTKEQFFSHNLPVEPQFRNANHNLFD